MEFHRPMLDLMPALGLALPVIAVLIGLAIWWDDATDNDDDDE
jgi:hypothetical protein